MVEADARDWPWLAWLMAQEFARPTRRRAPIWFLAAIMTPLFLMLASMPGTFHFDRKVTANLRERRSSDRDLLRWLLGCVTGLLVLMVPALVVSAMLGSDTPVTVTIGAVLSLFSVVLLGIPALLVAKKITTKANPGVVTAASGTVAIDTANWLLTSVAASPGTRGIKDHVVPLLLSKVPSTGVVGLRAANVYLAGVYREYDGFEQVGSNPLTLCWAHPAWLHEHAVQTGPAD